MSFLRRLFGRNTEETILPTTQKPKKSPKTTSRFHSPSQDVAPDLISANPGLFPGFFGGGDSGGDSGGCDGGGSSDGGGCD